MNGDYYIGLDLGTSSVGWAVTDPDYHLLRIRGHDAAGVRLFEEGKTAADRRLSRGARRRTDRMQARIKYVRRSLSPLIDRVDPDFYLRREESMLWEEDKTSKEKYSIFGKNGMSDSEFYKKYPTVSHLIVDMIRHPEKHTDPREYAIVIEQKFKHRGNFLLNGKFDDTSADFDEMYKQFADCVNETWQDTEDGVSSHVDFPASESVKEILTDKNKSISEKSSKLIDLFMKDSSSRKWTKEEKNRIKAILGLLCGKKEDLFKIWPEHPLRTEGQKSFSISLREKDLEESIQEIADRLTEPEIELLESIAQIFDWQQLESILKDRSGQTCSYLAEARVSQYEQHRVDLQQLKKLLKAADKKAFNAFFREYPAKPDNYSGYVGSVNSSSAGKKRGAKITQDDFYQGVKKVLKKLDFKELSESNKAELEEMKQDILHKIELNQFMPKQMTSKNGVIPNQVHLKELNKILENASMIFPEFREKDESGYTLAERLSMLFSFRIPYYIGPLGQGKESGTSWVVWNENQTAGPVYPWNIEQKINQEATSRAFIHRMLRACTYLPEYQVLPDHSLLYEKFKVLNELNNLKIDGNPLTPELKQRLYESEFLKGKKVTQKKIRKFLVEAQLMDHEQAAEAVISGIDGDFINKLGTERFFCEVLGTERLNDSQRAMAEKIVYWSTIYEEAGSFLKKAICSEFPELTPKQIKRILGNRFNGWGRCSREFLEMEGTDSQGNESTVMGFLWSTNDNLMQVLSDKYSFRKTIAENAAKEQKSLFEISHEDLDGLYLSGPVKRMIWQTIRILREITGLMGKAPKKVFVEMARESQEKGKRTVSRKNRFKELYKSIKDDTHHWLSEIENMEESLLQRKKVYLYLTQQGRDAYTGQPIDFEKLLQTNSEYDIDHIYAQRWVKDDSLENNLVLTNKQTNSDLKKDRYPLPLEIQAKMTPLWKQWLKAGLITQEKFNRLTRRTGFTDDELAGFINRQLVETRQGTKVLAAILKQTSPDTQIVYSKASNVSAFRKQFEIPKIRDLNNLHHAVDAYLNIVVGNVFSVRFTDSPVCFVKEFRDGTQKYNLKKLYDYPVTRGSESAWVPGEAGTIATVKRVAFKGTPLVTRRTVSNRGSLSDVQLCPAEERKEGTYYISRKRDAADPGKYGYYDKVRGATFFLVECQIKNKRERMILPLTLVDKQRYTTKEELDIYCRDILHLEAPSVRLMNIHPKSLLRINGYPLMLTGRSDVRLIFQNAVELILPAKDQIYLSKAIWPDNKGEYKFYLKSVSKRRNIELYDSLIAKFSSPIFEKIPRAFAENTISKKLESARPAFGSLSEKEQIEVLYKILKSFNSWNDEFAKDHSEFRFLPDPRLGRNLSTWRKQTGDKNKNAGECVLVLQSVTGLFSREIDLMKV